VLLDASQVPRQADLRREDVEAVVVGSDLRRTGWFTCSDPRLERLHENVVWSMRGTS
jgi:alpha-L-rhamnosidase